MGLFSNESDPNDKLDKLRNLVPLNALSDADLERVKGQARFETLKKGDYLFREGDKDHQHVYLLDGMVALYFGVKEVDMVFANSTTARFPIADGLPRKYTARAKKKCDIVRIDDRFLNKVLTKDTTPDYEVTTVESDSTDDWMSQLLKVPVFQRLPPDKLQGVITHMQEFPAKKGDQIILEGTSGDYFYLINRGRCLVTAEGKPTLRVELGPGSCFGEEALLSGHARNATVTLLTDALLLRLPAQHFVSFVRDPLDSGVSGDDAMAKIKGGARWLDIRSPDEFGAGSLPGSLHIPANDLRARAADLDKEKPYICYCDDGGRSRAAAFVLLELGFEAFYLRGGVANGVFAPVAKAAAKEEDLTRTGLFELKKKLEQAGVPQTDFLSQLDLAKTALTKGTEGTDRDKMRNALLRLKESLESKDAELAAARKNAEQALEMRGRLEEMEQLLQTESAEGGTKDLGLRLQQNTERYKQHLKSQEQRQGELKSELAHVLDKLAQIESQQAEVSNLQKQLLAAKKLREQAKQRIGDLERKQQESTSALEQAAGRVQNLTSRLSERTKAPAVDKAEIESLRKELETAQAERSAAQKQIDDLSHLSSTSRSELDQSAGKVKKLEEALQTRIRNEKEQEEKYQATLDALQRQLEDAKRSQEEVAKQAEAVASEREQLNSELAGMRAKIEQVEAEASEEVARLQHELHSTHAKLKEKERTGAASTEEQRALSTKLQSLSGALKKQQEALKRSEQERAGLKDFLESRADELHTLKSALASAQTEAEQASTKRAELEKTRQKMEKEMAKLQEEMVIARTQKEIAAAALEEERSLATAPGATNKLVVGLSAVIGMATAAAAVYFILGGSLEEPPPKPMTPPTVVETPTTPATPAAGTEPATTGEGTQGAPQVVIEDSIDRSGEPPTGTLMRDQLKTGGASPELVYVRGGRFRMGNEYDVLTSDERPVHMVFIKSFAVGRYEVTFDEYDQFAKVAGRPLPDDSGFGRGTKPVINVTWNDAVAYTKWLSDQTGHTYRLPSEAEWEYAARGNTDSPFWWGKQSGMNRANCYDCGSRFDRTLAPIGSFKPNPFGLYDTAGNVREWVEDCYNQNYHGAPPDGSAWTKKRCQERVVRGGAYNRPAQSMRSTKRDSLEQITPLPFVGVRVVREIEGAR